MAKGATPHWPLRTGVAAYAGPPTGEGAATKHPCLLQTAKLTPNFGFTLKKNRERSIYLFPPLQTAN